MWNPVQAWRNRKARQLVQLRQAIDQEKQWLRSLSPEAYRKEVDLACVGVLTGIFRNKHLVLFFLAAEEVEREKKPSRGAYVVH